MYKRKSEQQRVLDRLAKKYNFLPSSRKYEFWWHIYQIVCDYFEAGLLVVQKGNYDLHCLKAILENDGPDYSATVILNIADTAFYKIGVCVRGIPLFKKLSSHEIREIKTNIHGYFRH